MASKTEFQRVLLGTLSKKTTSSSIKSAVFELLCKQSSGKIFKLVVPNVFEFAATFKYSKTYAAPLFTCFVIIFRL